MSRLMLQQLLLVLMLTATIRTVASNVQEEIRNIPQTTNSSFARTETSGNSISGSETDFASQDSLLKDAITPIALQFGNTLKNLFGGQKLVQTVEIDNNSTLDRSGSSTSQTNATAEKSPDKNVYNFNTDVKVNQHFEIGSINTEKNSTYSSQGRTPESGSSNNIRPDLQNPNPNPFSEFLRPPPAVPVQSSALFRKQHRRDNFSEPSQRLKSSYSSVQSEAYSRSDESSSHTDGAEYENEPREKRRVTYGRNEVASETHSYEHKPKEKTQQLGYEEHKSSNVAAQTLLSAEDERFPSSHSILPSLNANYEPYIQEKKKFYFLHYGAPSPRFQSSYALYHPMEFTAQIVPSHTFSNEYHDTLYITDEHVDSSKPFKDDKFQCCNPCFDYAGFHRDCKLEFFYDEQGVAGYDGSCLNDPGFYRKCNPCGRARKVVKIPKPGSLDVLEFENYEEIRKSGQSFKDDEGNLFQFISRALLYNEQGGNFTYRIPDDYDTSEMFKYFNGPRSDDPQKIAKRLSELVAVDSGNFEKFYRLLKSYF